MNHSIITAVIISLLILYINFENRNLKVSHYFIKSKNLPGEFHGTKFVVLADLHNNSYGKDNEILIKYISAINPDFIIVAGDMIVGTEHNDYSIAFSILSKLALNYPIYYGYGNHEQRVMAGSNHYDKQFDEYIKNLQALGVNILVNDSMTLRKNKEQITITGLLLGNEYFKKFKQKKMEPSYLENLLGISDKKCYNILIAHNPAYFKNYLDWGADLILSGHLHGGIARLPVVGGVISPQYKLFPPYDAGQFHENGKTLLVSRGLGTHTIKIRAFNPPELMTVILEKEYI